MNRYGTRRSPSIRSKILTSLPRRRTRSMMKFARLSALTLLIASGASPVCAQVTGPTVSPLLVPAGLPGLVPEIMPKPLPNPVRAVIEAALDGGKQSEVETEVAIAKANHPPSIGDTAPNLPPYEA